MIGDGDSNTIIKCKERVSYGRKVLKIECANHAVRRYGRALQKIQLNAARFKGVEGIRGRKILKQRMMRLIKGVINVIKVNSVKTHNEPQRKSVLNIIEDLRNVPNHVFGEISAKRLVKEKIWNLMKLYIICYIIDDK
ncbi:hypothetical protein AVEN_85168-1 [Araneus ventricosus]|uniref:Mutator-like transposase domain-containing protein n=1 Tax=Araneus ventricosus TaxID=182803 RepID=A0A4Y2I920_ARAVE|nr:hypothetical protein AVEN_85168-1 [Araneus ventricosus]